MPVMAINSLTTQKRLIEASSRKSCGSERYVPSIFRICDDRSNSRALSQKLLFDWRLTYPALRWGFECQSLTCNRSNAANAVPYVETPSIAVGLTASIRYR